MHGSQYVTNQFDVRIPVRGLHTNLRRMLATKFFSSSTRWRSRNSLVTKPYGVQMQQLLLEKIKTYVSSSQYACEKLLHWGALAMTALKTIFIYVWDCEKRKPKLLLAPLYGSITPYILMLSFYVHQFPMNFFISFSLIHHLPWSSKFFE